MLRFHNIPLLAAGAVAAALFALPAAGAQAGILEIVSCGAAPVGGADDAWQYRSDDAAGYEEAPTVCPPDGSQYGGIGAWSKLNSGVAPAAGTGAQLRFTAPSGTTISAVTVDRDIGLRSDGYYVFGRTDGGQLDGETCTRDPDAFTCDVGGAETAAATFSDLSAGWVAWGFQCGAKGFVTCGTGATLHSAWAVIYSSTVTLTDNQFPSVPVVGGAVTTAGWKAGSVAATATATDNLGIRRLRWYADGALVQSDPDRACDFSTPVPCADASAAATFLDTTALADGTRSVQLAVVDPAGNETQSAAFDIAVDNTPPATPTGLSVSGGGRSPSFALTWTDPPPDAGSPFASSSWRACPRGGGGCVTGTGTLAGASGTLPAAGSYDVALWLVDAAGNGTPANAATSTISYAPPSGGGGGGGSGGGGAATPVSDDPKPATPAPPGPPSAPAPPATPITTPPADPEPVARADAHVTATARRHRRRLTVRGRIDRRATGRVTVRWRARIHHHRRTRTARARIRHGRFVAHLHLPAGCRHARHVRLTVRYAGNVAVASQRLRLSITPTARPRRPHRGRTANARRNVTPTVRSAGNAAVAQQRLRVSPPSGASANGAR